MSEVMPKNPRDLERRILDCILAFERATHQREVVEQVLIARGMIEEDTELVDVVVKTAMRRKIPTTER